MNAFSPFRRVHPIAGSATLDLNKLNQTIGLLAGAGSLTLGSAGALQDHQLFAGNANFSLLASGEGWSNSSSARSNRLKCKASADGYARVSTRDQDLIAQDAELMAAGCSKVFKEKISGAKTDRPELAKVIRRLEPGDVLLVTRLDRLARSTRDLLNVLAAVGERGAGFKSLKDAWADTTTAHGRLMLTVLGGLAEFERELIMARTGEGRLRAKARGVRFGRPRTLTPHQRQEAIQRLAEGEVQPISRGLTA